ncbi:MAG TPA: Lrp/AsnC family transcriptional regulator [Thermoanaerobaculia bacterium]|nr:Lrp/AsnC family transcriptional regulator [Thermoanaerobaculia bacterium]
MDDLDRKILDIVQRNNQSPADAIARQIGLSASAVQRRLKRLRDSGVIEGDVSTVSPEALGRNFLAIVSIVLEAESPQIRRKFAAIAREMPEIMQCYFVTGETADFFLVITARDKDDYNAIMLRLTDRFPGIKRYTTNVVLERLKSGLSVPT